MQKVFTIGPLELGKVTPTNFKIHPCVPLQILESFYRRKYDFVIGTLLGSYK